MLSTSFTMRSRSGSKPDSEKSDLDGIEFEKF
jgi:hypothetical protein